MGPLSKYWEILRIDPGGNGCGYKKQSLPLASEFFQAEFSQLAHTDPSVRSHPPMQTHRSVQTSLHHQFTTHPPAVDVQSQVNAGLCLRSYVSYAILRACKHLASQFAATGQFTYHDLLPYVLNDDGGMHIVLDQNGAQWILTRNGQPEKYVYQLFSVEVLRKFNPKAQRVSSLDNWVHLQTRQNKDLQDFLSEQGLYKSSDWALLNRAGANQLDSLSLRERQIIEVFHAVYRRDRRQQQQNRGQPCPDPDPDQLQEMQHRLQERGITFDLLGQLKTELKQLAQVLRQYAIWNSNGMPQSESLEQKEFCDPNSINDLDHIAQQELREFCRQQLVNCLDWGIDQGICEHIRNLSQRPRYAVFASKVTAILKLVYCQRQSQRKIADTLGMTNQSQVSRVLNPTKLLNRVRYWTVDHFFQILSVQVSNLNLATVSTDPDYLKNLMQHIEAFVDAEAFQAAFAEIKTAKNLSMNSLYAQRLRHYIEK